jgi:hypothetical protein
LRYVFKNTATIPETQAINGPDSAICTRGLTGKFCLRDSRILTLSEITMEEFTPVNKYHVLFMLGTGYFYSVPVFPCVFEQCFMGQLLVEV